MHPVFPMDAACHYPLLQPRPPAGCLPSSCSSLQGSPAGVLSLSSSCPMRLLCGRSVLPLPESVSLWRQFPVSPACLVGIPMSLVPGLILLLYPSSFSSLILVLSFCHSIFNVSSFQRVFSPTLILSFSLTCIIPWVLVQSQVGANTSNFRIFLSTPKETLTLQQSYPIPPNPSALLSGSVALSTLDISQKRKPATCGLQRWLVSLRIIVSRFTYVTACVSTLFRFIAKCFSSTCCVLSVHPCISFYCPSLGLSVSLDTGTGGPSQGGLCSTGAMLNPMTLLSQGSQHAQPPLAPLGQHSVPLGCHSPLLGPQWSDLAPIWSHAAPLCPHFAHRPCLCQTKGILRL